MDEVLQIDCDECAMQGTDACADCVVTFLCDRADVVTLDQVEARALRLLANGGLAPRLRHVRRTARGPMRIPRALR